LDLGIGLGSLYVGWIADLFSLSAAFKVSAIILAFAFIYFLIKTLPHYNLSKVVE
jgi:predicted MFS family arabinose efflux permease